jgi:hypothetical protein
MKALLMKGIKLFLLLLSLRTLNAQVNVSATIGAGSGNYPSLRSAFDAINTGMHQGDIEIILTASITETATAKLNASGGSSSYTSIKILPATQCTISGSLADALIDLDGADSVLIDGRIGSTGSTRSLTLSNTFSTANISTSTIRLVNGAQRNRIQYLNIEGSGQNQDGGTVWITNSNNSQSNSHNIIDNNEIKPAGSIFPAAGLRAGGSNSFNSISKNLIHDFYSLTVLGGGIVVQGSNTNYTVTGNSLYQETPKPGSPAYIQNYISLVGGDGNIIKNNFIGGSAPGATAAPATYLGQVFVIGIEAYQTSSDIDSNLVTNFKISHTPFSGNSDYLIFQGIHIQTGIYNVRHNTIGSLTDTGAIVISCSGGSASWGMTGLSCIGSTFPNVYTVSDNKIAGLSITGTSSAESFIWGILTQAVKTLTVFNNTIGGTVQMSIQNTSLSGNVTGIVMMQQVNGGVNSCTRNIIQNVWCNTTGSSNAGVVGIAAGFYGTQQPGNIMTSTIANNILLNLYSSNTSANNGSVKGIHLTTWFATPNTYMNTNIFSNEISNLISLGSGLSGSVMGISSECPYKDFLNIDSNRIYNFKNTSTNASHNQFASVQGINSILASDAPLNIRANTIYNLESVASNPTSVIAINCFHSSNNKPASIANNKIYDLRNSTGSTGRIIGVALRGGGGTGTFTAANNMISLKPNQAEVYGIVNDFAATKINLYYNSVLVGGATNVNNRSACFYRASTSGANVESLNNIFYNQRNGGSGDHYALINANTAPATGWTRSNFNDLYGISPQSVALWNGTALDFPAYKNISLQDTCSISSVVDFLEIDTANLHLQNSIQNRVLAGVTIPALVSDFDGDARHSIPSMGADEIIISVVAPTITALGAVSFCNGDNVTLRASVGTGVQWYKDGVAIIGAVNQVYQVQQSGTYNMQLTGTCHPITSNSITVTVYPVPPAPVISASGPTAFCNGDSVIFTSSAASSQWYNNGVVIPGAVGLMYIAKQSGLYSATATISSCISAHSTPPVSVAVYPIPSVPVIVQNGNRLQSSSAAGNQWFVDGVIIQGAIGQNLLPTSEGEYTVEVMLNNCKSGMSLPLNFRKSILLYPNPAARSLKLKISGYDEMMAIIIYNAIGQKVLQQTVAAANANPLDINISNLTGGSYELVLITLGGVIRKRFIKL